MIFSINKNKELSQVKGNKGGIYKRKPTIFIRLLLK